ARMVAAPAAPDAALLRALLESGLSSAPAQANPDFNLRWNLDRTERRLLLEALEHTAGVRKEAAELLGIDARNMGYYLRKHRLSDVVPRR
ncbi:helix-turn-helix domain-containing protein, partial [Clostridium perfringens]|nr:helix-turn-helix domain-containing protein [Clostridium perfringens]